MEKRALGNTGLSVSIIGLGAHLFPKNGREYYEGFYGRRFVEGEAIEARRPVVEAALEEGINLFAADFDFEARALAKLLKELGAKNRVLLTAAVDFRPSADEPINWADLEARIDHWLKLLDVDRLDLPQIRIADWFLEAGILDDLTEALRRLKDKGKIAVPAYYSSDRDIEVLKAGVKRGVFPAVMRAFGLLNPRPAEELLPLVKEKGAGFIGFVPFQKGLLFDCGIEAGLSEAETARTGLGWAFSQPGVTALLCGAADPEEVRANAAAAGGLGLDMKEKIARLSRTRAYDSFLAVIREQAPQLAFDLREVF